MANDISAFEIRSTDTLPGGFLPSMMGLAKGLLAPSASSDRACTADYNRGDAPFRHQACHDPRRFAIVAVPATVDAAGRLTVPVTPTDGPIRVFRFGIGEADPDSFTGFQARTAADTNIEAGGYLIPPGYEGLVSAIGFSPVGITTAPAQPNTFANWADPVTPTDDYEPAWRRIFSGIAASVDYWETTTKAERILGNIERWPVGDAMDHTLLATNGARGAFGRLNPLQFQVPTLGPEERRSDERADRFTVLLRVPRQIEAVIPAGGTALAQGNYLLLIRVEIAVGLMVDQAKQVDVQQDNKLDSQERRLAQMERTLGALAARLGLPPA